MSAYVCDNETFDRIVSHFHFSGSDYLISHAKRQLKKIGFDVEAGANKSAVIIDLADAMSGCEKLALALLQMNIDAVNARYGEGEAEKFRPLDYKPRFTMPCGKHQLFKTLECYLYQCSEGDIPDRPLYQILDEMKSCIASDIVRNTPQYELAKWG